MKPNFFSCLSVLSLFAIQSDAATIDWTNAVINDINDVVTTGTLVDAQNHAGTGANATVTVAGIDFDQTTAPLTSNHNGDFFAFDTGDADYNELLGDIDFGPSGQGALTLSFTGLTDGADYLIQVWYSDDGGVSNGRTMTLTGTGDNVLQGNEYGLGTFTADATNQNLVISSSAQGVRLNAVQLREISGPPTGSVTVADAAADYQSAPGYVAGTTAPSAPPANWSYIYSNSATGGTEVALTPQMDVGNEGNQGFEGPSAGNTPAILGGITGANDFEIFNNATNAGVVGTDLLMHPGNSTETSVVIARYTISAADILNGTSALISGSFRRGNSGGNTGVEVSVYQNGASLWSVDSNTSGGTDLPIGDGTFSLSGVPVAENDTISFVVDAIGNYNGDETALQASISIGTEPADVVDDFFNVLTSSTTDLDVLANDPIGNGVDALDLSTLQITSHPSLGTASVQPDDTIQYVHGGTEGVDQLEYEIDDVAGTNTYTAVVEILANNGMKEANSSLNFSAQAPSGGWQFPDAFPGVSFSQPTCIETRSGSTENLFVTERAGRIYLIPDVAAASPTKSLFLDMSSSSNVRTTTFCGLRGLAFHPDFENNRYFYVGYDSTDSFNGESASSRVSRFTANADLSTVNPNTEVILFQQGTGGQGEGIHRINRMLFGPDGYLYIAVGDNGNYDGPANSQRIDDDFWSSVLRIDVDKQAGNFEPNKLAGVTINPSTSKAYYSIPADNPYVTNTGDGVSTFNGSAVNSSDVRTEMYCVGFRNPWKIGFVPGTSDLWVADVAALGYEKICIMPKGGNAGWGHLEGTGAGPLQVGSGQYSSPLSDPPASSTYIQPILEYTVPGNGAGSGVKSIVGGAFYEGTDIAELTGAFVFADYTKGDIWYMQRPDPSAYQSVGRVALGGDWGMDETGMTTEVISEANNFEAKHYGVSKVEKMGTEAGIIAMTPDPSDKSILMLDYSGIIRRLEFNVDDGSLPATLTDTGAFSDLATLTPNAGVHPYDLNLRFWSDKADKTRWFAVDDPTDTISYSEDGLWGAPAGAVWIKHFDMDLNRDNPGTNVKRLETRFLVKTEDDFYGVSYRWNEAGTEADLVDTAGEDFDLTITEGGSMHTQTWRIPSRGDCRVCHTNDNEVMLGFNTRQLNLDGSLSGGSGNFIQQLKEAGYLSSPTGLPTDYASLPKYHTPDDTSVDLEERVRSYLAVNCSYCHYEGGTVAPNTWSGEPHLTIEETNLLHGEGEGFAVVDPTDRFVIPGNTTKSMILSLASASNGYGRMPPLATDIVDSEGVALLTDWINNYANAMPTLDATAGPYTVAENTPAVSVVGSGPQVSDPDDPDPSRGTLVYSIVGGNEGGYFDIDPATGQITVVQNGLDYEETTTHSLSILASDGFAPNPGEVTSNVVIDISDIVGDDSQPDGIEDEWAVANFGFSAIDPAGDTDKDGSVELLEFWADSDPNDPSSRGLVIAPYEADSTPGSEGYSFEWIIRSDLAIGTDYFVQGADDLNFSELVPVTDFTIISTDPVDNGAGPALTRVRVKVPTTSDRYFLRVSSVSE